MVVYCVHLCQIADGCSVNGQISPEDGNYVEYLFCDSTDASEFISSFLAPSQGQTTTAMTTGDDTTLTTPDEVGKGSCGCTDFITNLLNFGVNVGTADFFDSSSFCNAVIAEITDWETGFVCSTGILGTLEQKLCDQFIDPLTKLEGRAVKPVCQQAVTLITKVTGVDLNTFYNNVRDALTTDISTIAKATCGQLLCSSTTGDLASVCEVSSNAPRA